MKKVIALILCVLSACAVFVGCGEKPAETTQQPAQNAAVEYKWAFAKKNDGVNNLKTECDQKGTVVEFTYETPAYAVNDIFGQNLTLTKKATVYLPYGYDAAKQYNVLYLLHGTKGESDGPMEEFWMVQWGSETRNVLDNMIKNGLCEPLIVVCPNYYSPVEGFELGDAEAKALAEKLGDQYIWSETAEDGDTPDNAQNIWPVYFGQELRNNLIPAFEAEYLTYANKDVSEQSLVASREHRAFAGLSRGAMTVARAGLTENADIIAWFGSFSGVWQEFEPFKAALTETFKDYPIKFWYNGNGKADFAKSNHDEFIEKVKSELPDTFTDGENLAYVIKRDGAHMYKSWIVDLHNALLVFFR